MGDFECYSTNKRKARVEHGCDECGATVAPGDEYYDQRWLHDGRWWQHKACSACMVIMKRVWQEHREGIELKEYVWGYNDVDQIVIDPHLLAFVVRSAEADADRTYAMIKEEGGERRAWHLARRAAERLLVVLKEVQRSGQA